MATNAIRRSATSRLEDGLAIWQAGSSATDKIEEAEEQRIFDNLDSEKIDARSSREVENLVSSGHGEDSSSEDDANHTTLDAISVNDAITGQEQVRCHGQGIPVPAQSSTADAALANSANTIPREDSCHPLLVEDLDVNEADGFEPVEDLPSLPKLDFKPILLRKWTLAILNLFYVGVIVGLVTLYYYENKATIFHVRATASRFTIRILPSLIGTLSTLLFLAMFSSLMHMVPYILMAAPIRAGDKCAPTRRTLLAKYFPLHNMANTWNNRHYPLTIMMVVQFFLNPFITPAKSALIQKAPSAEDPNLWKISISAPSARYLIFNYSVLLLIVLGVQIYLWNRRTGLKWDPVSMADLMVLLQGSDILYDFCGLEYSLAYGLSEGDARLSALGHERYRLGYWRHRRSNHYWHGIRKWPNSGRSSSTSRNSRIRPTNVQRESRRSLPLLPSSTPAASTRTPTPLDEVSEIEPAARGPVSAREDFSMKGMPSIEDDSREALAWWKFQCQRILETQKLVYRYGSFWITDFMSMVYYLLVAGTAGLGIWIISTDRLGSGFKFPSNEFGIANFALKFVPTFYFGLLNNYWYQIDIWYRLMQPFMGLRQPLPARENLLLGYPCDLPIMITVKALAAGHWRLAYASAMPLVQRILPVVAGSMLDINTTTSREEFHITFAPEPFKAALGILCSYLVLIPLVLLGPDQHLLINPCSIASPVILFYDSSLISKDAFYPKNMDEQRWHMKYRLCLEERRYGFGIYAGHKGALHLGIDDVCGDHEHKKGLQLVAPVESKKRLYQRWMKSAWPSIAKALHIKRQETDHNEEMDILERVQNHLQETNSVLSSRPQESEGAGTAQEEHTAPNSDLPHTRS